jgi:hypothetical protein
MSKQVYSYTYLLNAIRDVLDLSPLPYTKESMLENKAGVYRPTKAKKVKCKNDRLSTSPKVE